MSGVFFTMHATQTMFFINRMKGLLITLCGKLLNVDFERLSKMFTDSLFYSPYLQCCIISGQLRNNYTFMVVCRHSRHRLRLCSQLNIEKVTLSVRHKVVSLCHHSAETTIEPQLKSFCCLNHTQDSGCKPQLAVSQSSTFHAHRPP